MVCKCYNEFSSEASDRAVILGKIWGLLKQWWRITNKSRASERVSTQQAQSTKPVVQACVWLGPGCTRATDHRTAAGAPDDPQAATSDMQDCARLGRRSDICGAFHRPFAAVILSLSTALETKACDLTQPPQQDLTLEQASTIRHKHWPDEQWSDLISSVVAEVFGTAEMDEGTTNPLRLNSSNRTRWLCEHTMRSNKRIDEIDTRMGVIEAKVDQISLQQNEMQAELKAEIKEQMDTLTQNLQELLAAQPRIARP